MHRSPGAWRPSQQDDQEFNRFRTSNRRGSHWNATLTLATMTFDALSDVELQRFEHDVLHLGLYGTRTDTASDLVSRPRTHPALPSLVNASMR
jgi:hypothetical protein